MNRNVGWLVMGLFHIASLAPAIAQAEEAKPRSQSATSFERREHREGSRKLAYRLMVPRAYDGSKAWPLVIWLHGAGEIGSDNTAQLTGINATFLADSQNCPAIVVAPQCPEGSSWLGVGLNEPPKITEPSRLLIQTIVELQKEFKIDNRRIYLGGFSMGSCGCWDLLSRYPNLFAAAFPIAGPPGDRPGLAPLIKHVPIWVFHGDKDRFAPVESSRAIVAALKAVDASVKYTEYKNGSHECHQALAEPLLQKWLFAQLRAAPPVYSPSNVPEDASLITKTLPHGKHDTWTGKVEGTRHGAPRFIIEGVYYRLKAAADASAEVNALLTKIGKRETTSDHTITGTIHLDDRAWLVVEKIVSAGGK